jgi:dTDP-4-amino-4,6-dideoxygalactose transaminase
MNIPYAKVSLNGNELKYLKEVLKSGWLTTSKKAFEFEKQFAEYTGTRYACAVNSCTAALHLAVESIGIKPGDKVLVPSLTFTSSAEILRYLGADPVFMDVEYGTCLVTPSILRSALERNQGISALILVHYGGQAAKMTTPEGEGIVDICRSFGIRLIEDAAHAFPTRFNNQYIGSFGDITCFSFYANKTITSGEGGMIVTNHEDIYRRVKLMRLHGINHDVWDRFTSTNSSWEYDIIAPGFKYNLSDLNAAIGLAQLERAEQMRYERQRCASFYLENLKGIHSLDLPLCHGPMEDHSWHLFPVVLKPDASVSRNEFIRKMADNGIGTSVHYKPLHRMKYYKETYSINPVNFPNTEKIWQGTVSLPIYPDLRDSQLTFICKTIKKILL